MPATPHSRRLFLGAVCCALLCAAPGPEFYRLRQFDTVWRIVAPDGIPIDLSPGVTESASTIPFFAAVPLTLQNGFVDPFDSTFQMELVKRCTARAQALRTNKVAIAYIFTRVPVWRRDWVSWIRSLPPDAEGKQQYLQFLKQTYDYNIGQLASTYAIESTSFTDLAIYPWDRLDTSRAVVRRDDEAFLGWIAQILFATAADAIRKHDPNHLILGQAMTADVPSSVIDACAPSLDAVWLNGSAETSLRPTTPVLRTIP